VPASGTLTNVGLADCLLQMDQRIALANQPSDGEQEDPAFYETWPDLTDGGRRALASYRELGN